MKGKINLYQCDKCDLKIVTVNADDGATPFSVSCRSSECVGWMKSAFYLVPQDLKPTHEFYLPKSGNQPLRLRKIVGDEDGPGNKT